MKEEWKKIIVDDEEYEYYVSNYGRVYSLKTNKMLKPRDTSKGYYRVALRKDGKAKDFLVHRLVAIMFIPNDDNEKIEINHIDENTKNNRVDNLEWCTSKYNVNYGGRTSRQIETRMKIGRKIRCIETGIIYENVSDASRKCNLDIGSLCHCLAGRRKTCGKLHWEYI